MINYNQPFHFEINTELEFADFTLTYVGESQSEIVIGSSRIPSTKKEFKIKFDNEEKSLVVSSGTGMLTPLRFSLVKKKATFEFNPWVDESVMMKSELDLTRIGDMLQLSQEDVNDLSESDFMIYRKTLGEGYFMFNGKINLHNSDLEPEPLYYGTPSKRLAKRGDDWQIVQGGGLLPDFEMKPVLLSKGDFTREMKKLGVSESKLEEYFNYKPDYTDF